VPETFRSGSSSIGGGHTRQSIARAFPGQTAPAGLEGLLPGHARPGSLKPALFCFLCFFKCLLLIVVALAGVTAGTTSDIAYVASKHQKLDRNSALASFVRTVVQIALG
jgi:uncharacterized membrane protein